MCLRDPCFEVWFPISFKRKERKRERERETKGDLFLIGLRTVDLLKLLHTPPFDIKKSGSCHKLSNTTKEMTVEGEPGVDTLGNFLLRYNVISVSDERE
jgi:hypothetical protein